MGYSPRRRACAGPGVRQRLGRSQEHAEVCRLGLYLTVGLARQVQIGPLLARLCMTADHHPLAKPPCPDPVTQHDLSNRRSGLMGGLTVALPRAGLPLHSWFAPIRPGHRSHEISARPSSRQMWTLSVQSSDAKHPDATHCPRCFTLGQLLGGRCQSSDPDPLNRNQHDWAIRRLLGLSQTIRDMLAAGCVQECVQFDRSEYACRERRTQAAYRRGTFE